MKWHLVTGEYSPAVGGVAGYVAALERALVEAGDDVEVWAPSPAPGAERAHPLPDAFGAESRRMLSSAWRDRRGRVLVQYVPGAFGARGLNLAFCRWLVRERMQGQDVRVMFHEPYMYFSWRPQDALRAIVQRRMAASMLRASTQAYYSTEAWRRYLRRRRGAPDPIVLSIPSAVAACDSPARVEAMRCRLANGGGSLVGHFGTYGNHVATMLHAWVRAIAAALPDARYALIGRNGERFVSALARSDPRIAARCTASGELDDADTAAAITACDVMAQPYPDGVTTRRSSLMACLACGVATVTTAGALTEALWSETRAVGLVPRADAALAADAIRGLAGDAVARGALARRGRATYERCFSMERTVAALRGAEAVAPSSR